MRNDTRSHAHLTPHDFVHDIVNHPKFNGFGQYQRPWDDDSAYEKTSLKNVRALLPHHSNVQPIIVVDALNHMVDQINDGQTIFYDFYTERQKQADPSKKSTGLFFCRGIRERRLPLCVRRVALPISIPCMKAPTRSNLANEGIMSLP